MKFLPYSNGVRSVNMRRQRSPKDKFKLISGIIVTIIVIGFVTQSIVNFVDGEKLKKRVNYTTVDDLRLDYRIEGRVTTLLFLMGILVLP